ncbi:GIP [Symbiodinium sp. CCMP2592]|nr:GIP [Symbiodinium sp. CCMP2592]
MATGSLAWRPHQDLETDQTKVGFVVYAGTVRDCRDFHEWEFRAMTRTAINEAFLTDLLLDSSGFGRQERPMVLTLMAGSTATKEAERRWNWERNTWKGAKGAKGGKKGHGTGSQKGRLARPTWRKKRLTTDASLKDNAFLGTEGFDENVRESLAFLADVVAQAETVAFMTRSRSKAKGKGKPVASKGAHSYRPRTTSLTVQDRRKKLQEINARHVASKVTGLETESVPAKADKRARLRTLRR